jgi:formiminotetrahydrofolate cyclodeaminase
MTAIAAGLVSLVAERSAASADADPTSRERLERAHAAALGQAHRSLALADADAQAFETFLEAPEDHVPAALAVPAAILRGCQDLAEHASSIADACKRDLASDLRCATRTLDAAVQSVAAIIDADLMVIERAGDADRDGDGPDPRLDIDAVRASTSDRLGEVLRLGERTRAVLDQRERERAADPTRARAGG